MVDEVYHIEGRLPGLKGRRLVELERRTKDGRWVLYRQRRTSESGAYTFAVWGDRRVARWRVVAPRVGDGRGWKRPARTRVVTVRPTSQRVGIAPLPGVAVPGDTLDVDVTLAPVRPERRVVFTLVDRTGTVRERVTSHMDRLGRVSFTAVAPPVFGPLQVQVQAARFRSAEPSEAVAEVQVVSSLRTEIVAHRGGMPRLENTLPAYRAAIDARADWVETDIRQTADGRWVLMHDPGLERTTDVRKVFPGRPSYTVDSFTLDEIRQLSVREEGVRVPTLEEFLQLVAEEKVHASIELKINGAAAAQSVLAIVSQYPGAIAAYRGGLVELGSFELETLRALRALSPDVRLSWILSGPTSTFGDVGLLDSVAPPGSATTSTQVDAAHLAGLRVIPWTVNTESEMVRLASLGVDAIVTDYPDRARLAIRGP